MKYPSGLAFGTKGNMNGLTWNKSLNRTPGWSEHYSDDKAGAG